MQRSAQLAARLARTAAKRPVAAQAVVASLPSFISHSRSLATVSSTIPLSSSNVTVEIEAEPTTILSPGGDLHGFELKAGESSSVRSPFSSPFTIEYEPY
jgi:hypothetical protein